MKNGTLLVKNRNEKMYPKMSNLMLACTAKDKCVPRLEVEDQ